ncbi:MAG: methyltransferase [Wenzhouxiangellaceae bacterium]|nr:methyltransferase [Wenzhouxiangellaceae bacterium]
MSHKFLIPGCLLATVIFSSAPVLADEKLRAAVDDPARPAAEKQRDEYRNPYETLEFFGIEPDMTVVELAPGAGWYTEILGPYLGDQGRLIGAQVDLESDDTPAFYRDIVAAYEQRIADPERFGTVEMIAFNPAKESKLAEPGSVDMVLTFRSVHGWKRDGVFEQVLQAANEALKSGGVLGVVQHRLPEDRDDAEYTGYVKQNWVVAQAESSGFVLAESSAINANPADSADHPEGVWSLPPSLRNVAQGDREQQLEIGESDRMTLKFVKR